MASSRWSRGPTFIAYSPCSRDTSSYRRRPPATPTWQTPERVRTPMGECADSFALVVTPHRMTQIHHGQVVGLVPTVRLAGGRAFRRDDEAPFGCHGRGLVVTPSERAKVSPRRTPQAGTHRESNRDAPNTQPSHARHERCALVARLSRACDTHQRQRQLLLSVSRPEASSGERFQGPAGCSAARGLRTPCPHHSMTAHERVNAPCGCSRRIGHQHGGRAAYPLSVWGECVETRKVGDV
jgi:hypothetical protein